MFHKMCRVDGKTLKLLCVPLVLLWITNTKDEVLVAAEGNDPEYVVFQT